MNLKENGSIKLFLFFIVSILTLLSCAKLDSDSKTPVNSAIVSTKTSPAVSETPHLTDKQEDIIAKGKEVLMKENKLSWKIPPDWNKKLERENIITYGSASEAMFVNITGDLTSGEGEIPLEWHYKRALEMEKKGLVKNVRYLEIAGIRGVEFVEAVPNKEGWRRYNWMAHREFNGQPQNIQVVCGTKTFDFESRADVFASVLYSMKVKD